MIFFAWRRVPVILVGFYLLFLCLAVAPDQVRAESTAFKQAVAEASARDNDISAYYRDVGYKPLWTGGDRQDRARRVALMHALAKAGTHGLPTTRYDVQRLETQIQTARSPRDRGILEVEMSRIFLEYARDIQTGVLTPSQVDKHILREVPIRTRASYLVNLSQSSPREFFRALPPQSVEYNALMKHKLLLERRMSQGGWGDIVRAGKLEPGDRGAAVVALRDRLVRMGYMKRSSSIIYDDGLTQAVQQFQAAHGLAEDGVVGAGTLGEINVSVQARLQAVIVAMERERWMNKERGARHIEVNLTDFTAKIIDNGRVAFETRSVIGARDAKRQSPEFSDEMEYMVLNPSWFVPRSIATGEYLPELQENPNAVNHLIITDRNGRQIDRAAVDFTQYTARSFPFAMRQPPSQRNALGLVKFMFPNRHNIYLHDTPAKNLFGRETRAYSHGCIRLADPFDFAYALLEPQTADPERFFQSQLATGKESQINLETHVPVHLIYRTAVASDKGQLQFRRDIYGRDGRIWQALSQAGVDLEEMRG